MTTQKPPVLVPLFLVPVIAILFSCKNESSLPKLDTRQLATLYYQEDAQWYLDNTPFFECSDKEMEQVYYYRWKLYKAHLRNTGHKEYVVTEFINHVPWDRDPFCTINAASMHHIYEGRWLKDNRFMDGYIRNLFQLGGNNRRYSESVADAAYARYLVNGDSAFIKKQLDSMIHIYNQWEDHWEEAKHLYYIPAMPDATEYTIASIDASGGKDGFEGGEAFRPTINSYMYGNALAIAEIAAMKGDNTKADFFRQRAAVLKAGVEQSLWNDSLQHFTDRFKVNNQFVKYWDFIRGRELAGMAPWYFNLPSDKPNYNAAWKHVLDTNYLLGAHGLRTNEPSYEYYFKQFVYFEGKRGSQWNGPSWPYQTSQALTGLSNLLNNYREHAFTSADYVKLLRLYTRQHFLPGGKINLVENYDPNLGGPIVFYYWSNHYNHSSYNNLIISGLCGIRPSGSDTLDLNPLVDETIDYFFLDDVRYHGHKLSLVYDKDGTKYKAGKGLNVWVDGKKAKLIREKKKYRVVIGPRLHAGTIIQPENFALNIERKGYPLPTASANVNPDTALYQAVDGRIWYFPEITNRWTTEGSTSDTDWYGIDFGRPREISMVKIYPFSDGQKFAVPDSVYLEYLKDNKWSALAIKQRSPASITGNTLNTFSIEKITVNAVRLYLRHAQKHVALSEIECY